MEKKVALVKLKTSSAKPSKNPFTQDYRGRGKLLALLAEIR